MNKSFKPLIGVFQIDQIYKRAKNILELDILTSAYNKF